MDHFTGFGVDIQYKYLLRDKYYCIVYAIKAGVISSWGFVSTEHDPIVQAFKCALEMRDVAASLSFGGKAIKIGVGLNSGQVFIGNIGGEGKRQFTVLGLPVNLAARFESETKVLGAPIVMGKDFYNRLPSDLQSLVEKHEDRPIKGAGLQTVYTYTPAPLAGEKYEDKA